MSYGYRVVKKKRDNSEESDVYYQVYEVNYDKSGNPQGVTNDPVNPWGNTMEEFELSMREYNKALDKPVLFLDNGKLIEVDE